MSRLLSKPRHHGFYSVRILWVTSGFVKTPDRIEGSWGRTFWIYRSKAPHRAGTVTTHLSRGLPTMYAVILEPLGEAPSGSASR